MVYSLKNVLNILIITILFLFIFSVIGVQLFQVSEYTLNYIFSIARSRSYTTTRPCKLFQILESGTFLLVESGILDFGIRISVLGIRNPRIQVPLTKNPQSSTWNPEIQCCLGLPYMGRDCAIERLVRKSLSPYMVFFALQSSKPYDALSTDGVLVWVNYS